MTRRSVPVPASSVACDGGAGTEFPLLDKAFPGGLLDLTDEQIDARLPGPNHIGWEAALEAQTYLAMVQDLYWEGD